MNKTGWWAWWLALVMACGGSSVLAKPLGSGVDIDKTPSAVTRAGGAPNAALAAPVPTAPAAPTAAPSEPPQQAWTNTWAAAATALGLAWLASSLEGQSWLQMLVMVALLLGGGLLLRWLLLRGGAPRQASLLATEPAGVPVAQPRGYSPQNVGNDASARPWESVAGSAASPDSAVRLPQGFDAVGFLNASKRNFLSLQDAWDRSDMPSLRAMMTDNMLTEIQAQLSERERAGANQNHKTEVVMLEARLLGLEELDGDYLASVEFSGLMREDPSLGPHPFREIWNITRPTVGDGGWLVAGVQALE